MSETDTATRIKSLAAQCGLSDTDPIGAIISEVALIPNEVRVMLEAHGRRMDAVAARIEQIGDPRVTQSVVTKLVHSQAWKETVTLTLVLGVIAAGMTAMFYFGQPTMQCSPDKDGHTICWYRKD